MKKDNLLKGTLSLITTHSRLATRLVQGLRRAILLGIRTKKLDRKARSGGLISATHSRDVQRQSLIERNLENQNLMVLHGIGLETIKNIKQSIIKSISYLVNLISAKDVKKKDSVEDKYIGRIYQVIISLKEVTGAGSVLSVMPTLTKQQSI